MHEEKRLASFFVEGSKSEKFEEVCDFFISWTLRCAETRYASINPKVNAYAKKLLFLLLFDTPKPQQDFIVESVITKKQEKGIDVWVEVKLKSENKIYILIIEDKFSSMLTKKQLEKYKDAAATLLSNHPNNIHRFTVRTNSSTHKNRQRKV